MFNCLLYSISYMKKKSRLVNYLLDVFIRQILKRRTKVFHKYSDEILKKFIEYAKQCNVEVFLFWGTHLGAYRDNNFIPHDCDMDFAVKSQEDIDKLKRHLENSDFTLLSEFFIPGEGIQEIKLAYNKISFDIFYVATVEDSCFAYCYDLEVHCHDGYAVCSPVQYHFPHFGLTEIDFRGTKCLIPDDSNGVLSAIYGDDFMTPNPKHKSGSRCKHKILFEYWEKPGFFKQY